MAVTLSLTDNADGTGGVAAITSPGAETNTVYTSSFDAAGEVGAWTSAGSRTGSGSVALSLTPGQYMVYVESNNAGTFTLSTVHWFTFTSGADCVHSRCLDAIVARLQSLGLAGIDSASIVAQSMPLDWRFQSKDKTPELDLPGIIVAPFGTELLNAQDGTNTRDNYGYPCTVSIIAKQDVSDLTGNRAARLGWRSQAMRAFENQRLPGVAEVWNSVVEPQAIISPAEWFQGLWNSSFLIRALSRETRGVAS